MIAYYEDRVRPGLVGRRHVTRMSGDTAASRVIIELDSESLRGSPASRGDDSDSERRSAALPSWPLPVRLAGSAVFSRPRSIPPSPSCAAAAAPLAAAAAAGRGAGRPLLGGVRGCGRRSARAGRHPCIHRAARAALPTTLHTGPARPPRPIPGPDRASNPARARAPATKESRRLPRVRPARLSSAPPPAAARRCTGGGGQPRPGWRQGPPPCSSESSRTGPSP